MKGNVTTILTNKDDNNNNMGSPIGSRESNVIVPPS